MRAQIQPASVVVILAGVYSTYSKWINIEIELGKVRISHMAREHLLVTH
ncbi:TIR domain-containing protein [Aeromonas caviae]